MSEPCPACGVQLDEIIKLRARIDELERSEYRPQIVAKLRAEVALANLEARAAQARCAALQQELTNLGATASERVIFLDFDGVINHSGTFATLGARYQSESTWSEFGEAEWFEPVDSADPYGRLKFGYGTKRVEQARQRLGDSATPEAVGAYLAKRS